VIVNISETDKAIDKWKTRIQQKKSDALWSTNNKVGHVTLDPPKSTSSEDNISTPKGCCPLKYAHVLDIYQGLLVHTPPGMGVPPTIFNKSVKKLA